MMLGVFAYLYVHQSDANQNVFVEVWVDGSIFFVYKKVIPVSFSFL